MYYITGLDSLLENNAWVVILHLGGESREQKDAATLRD